MSENNAAREKFKIDVEPADFGPVGEFKLTTTKQFGALVNEIFKEAFVDFEGVLFDPGSSTMEPTFSLVFNHGKYEEDERVGIKLAVADQGSADNNPVNRIRRMDNFYKNGAKFIATEDLQDVVEKILIPKFYNNGKINWGRIVLDYQEPKYNMYGYQQNDQYTKIIGISPKRLATLVYGYKDNDTEDIYDYEVRFLGSLNLGFGNNQSVLQILRASANEVNNLYKTFGYNVTNSNIIR